MHQFATGVMGVGLRIPYPSYTDGEPSGAPVRSPVWGLQYCRSFRRECLAKRSASIFILGWLGKLRHRVGLVLMPFHMDELDLVPKI